MSKYPGNIVTTGADTGYSVYFDGSNDYLSLGTQVAFPTSSINFTIEFWAYKLDAWGNADVRIFAETASGGLEIWTQTATGNLRLGASAVSSILDYPYSNLRTNIWTHFAYSRKNNDFALWVNGVRVATVTQATSFNASPTSQTIGGGSGLSSWNGYLSNVRIIRNAFLYDPASTTINVPTQLFNITNTSLLTCNSPAIVDQSSNTFIISSNGNAAVSTFTPFTGYTAYNPALGAATPGIWTVSDALQAAANRSWNMYDPYFNLTTLKLSGNPVTNVPTWITDASTNNFAITVNGDARAAGLSPFSLTTFPNSGSGYFDGTGDLLTVPSNSAFSFGTGDFTIEGWMYLTNANNDYQSIFSFTHSNGAVAVRFGNSGSYNALFQVMTVGSAASNVWSTSYTQTALLNQWTHFAFTRSGTTARVFINGTQQSIASGTNPVSFTVNSFTDSTNIANSGTVYIGSDTAPSPYTGYLSNIRVIKGTALYTSNFTTPTAPLTAVTNTSLLTLQNSQSSNNNSFLDSSSNNFLITRNGNTTQGTFTPFSQTGWSNFFNGSSNLTLAANTALNLVSGAFTIEAFVFPTGSVGGQIVVQDDGGSNNQGWQFTRGASNYAFTWFRSATRSDNEVISGGVVKQNSWQHVAVAYDGTTLRLFVDGVIVATKTSPTFFASNVGTGIGAYPNNTATWFNGYISNIRFIKGGAAYTANFTPSTVPLTTSVSAGSVSLLTCQSNRFRDASTNNFALSTNGLPSVQAFSPFLTNNAYAPLTQGGSGYFDGAGDELSMADNAAFDLSSTDFTIEAWVYPTVINATNEICAQWGGVGNAPYLFKIVTAGRLQFVWTIGGGSGNTLTGTTVAAVVNQWNHVAVTRSGGTLSLFVNGVRDGTTGAITGAITNGTNPFYVGSIGGSEYLNGYMSGFRLIKGQALATTNFTPPTTPVNATQVGWNGSTASLTGTVSALLNFTNAGIVDTTTKNVPETVGNVRISTTQSRYGGSSMYFDGSGDYLRFLNGPNQNFAFGTADFTIEGWIYLNSSSYQDLLDIYDNNSSGRILFSVNTSRQLVFSGASGATRTSTSTSIPLSTWTHFALCRASSSTRLFIGGVQGNTTLADTTNYTCTTGVVVIGINGFDLSSNPLNAYVNDWRISKFARYTGNFTPPTSLLQNQ